jgi:uncharacterized protein (DUF58 family)
MPKQEHHWEFLDMGVISRLSRLTVSVRLPMLGAVTGIHRSATRGSSVEFAEYRKYAPGDDLRFLDWRVFARTDRFYMKEFEADTNLRCYLVLDTSASMKFASGDLTRFEYARKIAGTLAHLLVHQGDALGLVCFTDKALHDLPPRRTPSHLRQVLDTLSEVRPQHDVAVFHLLDRQEFDFDFHRPVRFVDMENGADLITDPVVVREAYRNAVNDYLAALSHGCREFDVDYRLTYLDQSYEAVLTHFLLQRIKRKKGGIK